MMTQINNVMGKAGEFPKEDYNKEYAETFRLLSLIVQNEDNAMLNLKSYFNELINTLGVGIFAKFIIYLFQRILASYPDKRKWVDMIICDTLKEMPYIDVSTCGSMKDIINTYHNMLSAIQKGISSESKVKDTLEEMYANVEFIVAKILLNINFRQIKHILQRNMNLSILTN